MSQEEWDEFYMGDDGSMTYYIDMVEQKFSRSSTADFYKRYDLLDSVDEMFKKIENTINHMNNCIWILLNQRYEFICWVYKWHTKTIYTSLSISK